MKNILRIIRIENFVFLLGVLYVYALFQFSWLLFLLLILVPDVCIIGYAKDPRLGAWTYNLAHSYVLPLLLVIVALILQIPPALAIALIWLAHISIDRACGFGLKLASFKETHLGRIGGAHEH